MKRDYITLSLGGDDTFEEFIRSEEALLQNYQGEPAYIGIDLSRGRIDATGFSLVFKSSEDNLFYMPLCIRIKRKAEFEEIDVSKVLNICIYLSDIGFNIGGIVGDSQTLGLFAQILVKYFGKERVQYNSVDRDTDAYMLMSFMIKKGRFKTYKNLPLQHEMQDLIYYKEIGKVDHPAIGSFQGAGGSEYATGEEAKIGSKDLADSACLALHACFISEGMEESDYIAQELVEKFDSTPFATAKVESGLQKLAGEDAIEVPLQSEDNRFVRTDPGKPVKERSPFSIAMDAYNEVKSDSTDVLTKLMRGYGDD
jgi:hypothetical protein